MQITKAGGILIAAFLLVLLCGMLSVADSRERFAQETGLDLDLIGVLQTEVDGVELTVVFVFINDRTFRSKISPELRAALYPYIGRNAFYVNPSVEQVVPRFGFSPFEISVRSEGGSLLSPEPAAWTEITAGFTTGRFEVNPGGSDKGSGSEGILVLDDAIDVSEAIELMYRGQVVRFHIEALSASASVPPTRPSATASHEPVDVAPLDETATLQQILMHDEFSADSMSALLGIDPDLVRVLLMTGRGEELRMLLVRLEAPILDSALGSDLLIALDPLIGTGAVMVWAFSVDGAAFSPWSFYIKQSGTNYVFFSSASFVELTDGFLRAERVAAGEVAAGVIRLPRSVNNSAPFAVYYGTSGVDYP